MTAPARRPRTVSTLRASTAAAQAALAAGVPAAAAATATVVTSGLPGLWLRPPGRDPHVLNVPQRLTNAGHFDIGPH